MYIYNDNIGKVELVDYMGSDLTVVNAARVSYGKHKKELDDKDKKLIRYLAKEKHVTPFGHCQLTFRFKVPLFVRSQHHRHRVWTFSEISRRYTAENLEFYYPPFWRGQAQDNKQMSAGILEDDNFSAYLVQHSERALDFYHDLVSKGVAREMARMVLPQNLYTEYYGSVNLHNMFHFLELRLHHHAQWEIQKVAEAMLELARPLYPESIKVWEELRDQQ